MNLGEIVNLASVRNASDIHISSDHPPIARVNGDIVYLNNNKLTPETITNIIKSITSEDQFKDFDENWDLDMSFKFDAKNRYRVNLFKTINGPGLVMRSIPTEIFSMEELNLPEVCKKFAELSKGIILVTGPTGSGKSTTLAAIIEYINTHFYKHVITIEDPIEFVYDSKRCLINQRELGSHAKSFAQSLRSALREDPDIILLGELRDLETIRLALTAAETGHLVFATLHTSSAAKTIDRIVDVFSAGDKPLVRAMLSTSLEGVIAQTLIPKRDGTGRVAAFEILVASVAIRNLIRENKIAQIQSLIQIGKEQGMMTMESYIEKLVLDRIIDPPHYVYKDGDSPEGKPASSNKSATHVKAQEEEF